MHFELPLACVITSFYNALKSLSSGYASLDYEEIGYVASDVVKLQALLNGKPVPDLSLVVHRSECLQVGRRLVKQLKKYVQRQLFEVALQAAIGGKVVARETIAATRKDVTAKCVSDCLPPPLHIHIHIHIHHAILTVRLASMAVTRQDG